MTFISTLLNYGAFRRFIFFKYTLSNYLAEVFSRIQLSVFYPSTVIRDVNRIRSLFDSRFTKHIN